MKSNIELPVVYDEIPSRERYIIRSMYIQEQNWNCYYCKKSLLKPAAKWVLQRKISPKIFPKNFFDSKIHLHHSHDTGMTLGAVHSYCNAVLWELEGK